jgi:hypothetical protein
MNSKYTKRNEPKRTAIKSLNLETAQPQKAQITERVMDIVKTPKSRRGLILFGTSRL